MSKEELSIRDGFGKGLMALGESNADVIAMSADLRSSLRMEEFSKEFPERFVEVGIAEQNMAGIAAGLALSGKIPFTGTFSCFQPMRNLDQIRTSICIMQANVKLISSHGGFSFAGDGIQIQALEDIAIMRTLPNMQVVVPADAEQAEQFTHDISEIDSAVYMRIGRSHTPYLSGHDLVEKEVFKKAEYGKLQMLRSGEDGLIVTCGYMVDRSLQAAVELEKQGKKFAVVNLHTIKPIDAEGLKALVGKHGKVVTVEEHQKAGGMGSAVIESLHESGLNFKAKQVGISDEFGATAKTSEELWDSRGLTVKNIIDAAESL